MSSPIPATDSTTDAGTTAVPEPSVEPTTQESTPSITPSPSPSVEPTTTPPQSSAAPTTQPTTSPPPPSSAPPESSAPPPSSSEQPTTPPPSSSADPTTSPSAAPSSEAPSSDAPSSAVQTTPPASSAPPSSAPAEQSSTSQAVLSSAIDVTTTDSQGRVMTTRPSLVTQTSVSTDGSGRVYTVTQVVHNPTGSLNDSGASNAGANGFFDNTGAVAGVFVVVGLAITAGVLAFVFFMLRRRRRQRLDRDVAAAAAAAAGAAHHRSGFDDDEDEKINPATTFNGGYASTDIHGQPQPSMGQYSDYEDPAGGYDHYAANLPPPGDRTSTATAAGMAGFGASSAQASYAHSYPPQPHDAYEEMQDYNAMTTERNHGGQPSGGYYFDPKDANQYDYTDDDAAYDYNERPTQEATRQGRPGSVGSVAQNGRNTERGLKVTNV